MKVFYVNERYAKYGYAGIGYFMAIMMTAFYIMMTGFVILIILTTVFPDFDKYMISLESKLPSIPSGIVLLGLIFLALRITIKEASLSDNSFTKEYVTKAVNYLLGYIFFTVLFALFIGMKFLRHHRGLA